MEEQQVFVDTSDAADLEMSSAKALKEQPKRVLMVIPEWKERNFFDIHSATHADFISVSHDADAFVVLDWLSTPYRICAKSHVTADGFRTS